MIFHLFQFPEQIDKTRLVAIFFPIFCKKALTSRKKSVILLLYGNDGTDRPPFAPQRAYCWWNVCSEETGATPELFPETETYVLR